MKKKTILYFLLFVFAASLVYRVLHPYHQGKVTRLTYIGSRTRVIVKKQNREEDALQKAPEIMLAMYSKPPKHNGKVIHNPFFKKREKKDIIQTPAERGSLPDKPAETSAEDPRVRVARELSRFRVFGSYEGEGKSMLFLQRGKDVLLVQKGDKIDGKYLIKDIEGSSLDLWAEDIKQDIHIDLSDF